MGELLIATNPDPDSRLPYLIRIPYGGGLVFRAGDTWPRTKAVYCYPIDEWPEDAEGVERVDEFRTMADLGVDLGQGFYFGQPTERPMAVDPRLVRPRPELV